MADDDLNVTIRVEDRVSEPARETSASMVLRPRNRDCGCTEGAVCRRNGNCPRLPNRPTEV